MRPYWRNVPRFALLYFSAIGIPVCAHSKSSGAFGAGPPSVCTFEPWLNAKTSARIDRTVNTSLLTEKLSGGFTLAVIKDSHIVLIQAYGFADSKTKKPMRADAILPIGSITKTFTAAIAVKLAGRKKVDLNEPVIGYLPSGVSLNPELVRSPVTLASLMTHRAGWPKDHVTRRNLQLKLPGGFDPSIADPASFSKKEFYRGLSLTRSLGSPPNERHYSNFGFHFVGHILELASGQSMEKLVADEIAIPIGMSDTTFYPHALQRARIPTGYAFDQRNERSVIVPPWRAGEIVGGAFLNSTVKSLAQYVAVLMDEGATAKLLGGASSDEILFKPYFEFMETNAWRAQALAWQISTFGPYGNIVRHTGDSDGHNAFVAFSRSRRLGIVLLTNNDSGANEYLANELLLILMQRDSAFNSLAPDRQQGGQTCELPTELLRHGDGIKNP